MTPDLLKSKIYAEIPKLEGWTTPERACLFAGHIVKFRPGRCVEIGVFGGRSLIAQAMALEHNKKGTIFGIDPWRTEATLEGENKENQDWWKTVDLHAIHRGTMEAIWNLGLEDRAIVIRSTGAQAQNFFPNWSLDSVFIDGNHSEVSSVRDVRQWGVKIRAGGFLWMDDCDWPSTREALRLVQGRFELVGDYGALKLFRSPKSLMRHGYKPPWGKEAEKEQPRYDEAVEQFKTPDNAPASAG